LNIFFFKTTNVKSQFHKKGPNFFFLELFFKFNFFFTYLQNIFSAKSRTSAFYSKKKITLGKYAKNYLDCEFEVCLECDVNLNTCKGMTEEDIINFWNQLLRETG